MAGSPACSICLHVPASRGSLSPHSTRSSSRLRPLSPLPSMPPRPQPSTSSTARNVTHPVTQDGCLELCFPSLVASVQFHQHCHSTKLVAIVEPRYSSTRFAPAPSLPPLLRPRPHLGVSPDPRIQYMHHDFSRRSPPSPNQRTPSRGHVMSSPFQSTAL